MHQSQSAVHTQTQTKPLIKEVRGEGKNVVLGITGTSGAIFGLRMLRALLMNDFNVDLILSEYAQYTISNECGVEITKTNVTTLFPDLVMVKSTVRIHNNLDLKSEIFTNDYVCSGMIIAPCAMGTVGGIATGSSNTLMEKSADYAFSYSKPLILVPRESPINAIHLRNMLAVIEAGGCIVPAMPSFEYSPRDFNDLGDYIAGKVLDLLCKNDKPLT